MMSYAEAITAAGADDCEGWGMHRPGTSHNDDECPATAASHGARWIAALQLIVDRLSANSTKKSASFVPDTLFLIIVPNGCDPDMVITWRPDKASAEAFVAIYNMNRYSDFAEVQDIPYI